MKLLIPKEQWRMAGVYLIRNSIDARVLVGSTINYKNRHHVYNGAFKRRKNNPYFQRFAEKHGWGVLTMEVLELVDLAGLDKQEAKRRLLAREQHWIDAFRSYEPDKGFNLNPIAGSRLGSKASDETREKNRKNMLGRKLRPLTDEEKRYHRERSPFKKPVCQFTLEGVFVRRWESILHAANTLKSVDHGGIGKCCWGEIGYYNNYIWRFDDGGAIQNVPPAQSRTSRAARAKAKQLTEVYLGPNFTGFCKYDPNTMGALIKDPVVEVPFESPEQFNQRSGRVA